MTTCYLIRHGTTAWVDGNRLHGITDIPLNEEGINQAKEAAKAMKGIRADLLFASPLSRAFQTAEIVGRELSLDPIPIDELQEIDFGWLEGLRFKENDFANDHSFKSRFVQFREDFIRAISGESRKKFYKRIVRGWQKILNQTAGRDFVLVAHSGVFNAILYYCFEKRFTNDGEFYSVYPGSITELFISQDDEVKLIRLNDHSHLRAWFPHKD